MASVTRTLYIGVTSDAAKRVYQHKNGLIDGFTKKYQIHSLIYLEEFRTSIEAITYEKKLKGRLRSRKIKLIESRNPDWKDLSAEW